MVTEMYVYIFRFLKWYYSHVEWGNNYVPRKIKVSLYH